VLLGNRGADIFSDGISKSLGSGERQPYLTGEVVDAMCGRKHMEDEPSAECTRASVAHGSKFALIVGDKIDALETTDKAALARWTSRPARLPRSAAVWTEIRSKSVRWLANEG